MKKLRYFFEALIVRALARFTPLIPRHGLLAFVRLSGTLAWLADWRGRQTAMENLRVAFGEKYTAGERRRIVRRSYQNFARTFADLFWFPGHPADELRALIDIEDVDPPAIAAEREKGAVYVTPHFGNFEVASFGWGLRGVPMTTVAQDFKNPALTPVFQTLRGAAGHALIPRQGAFVRLVKVLGRGGSVAMLTDLNMQPSKATTIVQCFGLKTCVTAVHALITQRFGRAVIPAVCVPLEDGRYQLKSFPPLLASSAEDVPAVVQQCWDVFEREIRKQPELWMWMYKHWRYLPGDETDALYPDYANASAPFRKQFAEARA